MTFGWKENHKYIQSATGLWRGVPVDMCSKK